VTYPVYARDAQLVMDGVSISSVTEVGDYVTVDGGQVDIRNSIFEGNALPDMDAIDLGLLPAGSVISNNVIFGFSGPNSDGIDLGEGSRAVRIQGNRITDIADKGISIGQGSSALIERNLIANAFEGVGVKDSLSAAAVVHTSFLDNDFGVAVFEKNPGRGGASASIANSVFAGSRQADIWADDLSSITAGYSVSDGDLIPGAGNSVGEPLFLDESTRNVHLQIRSAAIDAGDPASAPDPDGSVADAGMHAFAGFADGPVVINEINYNSAGIFDPEDWLELFNRTGSAVDLSGWTLIDGGLLPMTRFNDGQALAPGAFSVLSRDPGMFGTLFPASDVPTGLLERGLAGAGDALYLYDSAGVLQDSVAYDDAAPWPLEPDGNGPTLELLSPDRDNALAGSWAASADHGTPREANSVFATAAEPRAPSELPGAFALGAGYPNPFNPATVIPYALPVDARIDLSIYDVLGRRVAVLIEGQIAAGRHEVRWDASSLPSGVYLIALQARGASGTSLARLARSVVLAK
jgi:hypothetical protein